MPDDIVLTQGAAFPESDRAAIQNLAAAQQIIMQFIDPLVQATNDDNPEALQYWQIAKALNKSVEVYCE